MKVKGLQEIAKFFEVDPRTVRNWRARGAPITKRYEADLGEVQLWRAKMKKGGGEAAVQGFLGPQRGKDYEETRLKKAQADKMELEVKVRRGQLIERREVERLFVERILAVKQGLLAFARSLPPQLIHCASEREMEEVIGREVRALLEAYSRPLPTGMQGNGQSESGPAI